MEAIKNMFLDFIDDFIKALNHAFGGIGLWLILDELGIIQSIKFHFSGMGGGQ